MPRVGPAVAEGGLVSRERGMDVAISGLRKWGSSPTAFLRTVWPWRRRPARVCTEGGAHMSAWSSLRHGIIICGILGCMKMPAATDIVSTVAGNGANTDWRDGIAATSASIAGLARCGNGVVIDGSGNVFFADQGANRVRKMSAAGTVCRGCRRRASTLKASRRPPRI